MDDECEECGATGMTVCKECSRWLCIRCIFVHTSLKTPTTLLCRKCKDAAD